MKFGDLAHGTISSFDDKGRGVFGRSVVPFSYPGDEVEAMMIRRQHGTSILELKNVITPSSDRVSTPDDPSIEHPGMIWGRMAYDAQLRHKKDMVNAAFEKAGHEERIETVIGSEQREFYRNRMDYVVGWKGEIGLKQYGSWSRFLDLKKDLLLSPVAKDILEAARDFLRESGLRPWDNKKYVGDVRYVVVREGKATGQRLVIFVVHDAKRVTAEHRAWLAERLKPLCTSLLIGEQPKITDLSLAERFEVIFGEPYLEEEVNGIRYRIAPNSFFQTNTTMAAKLQEAVLNLCRPERSRGISKENSGRDDGKILDLYCGLGFFGIAIAKNNPNIQVSGFELDAEAIELAKHNAEVNGVADRTEFASGPAEDLSWKDIKADTIILDPPRAGLHPKVIKTVLEMKPREIIYVSCNYHRLVQELKEFKTTYRVDALTALDLFPHTPHVEVVAKLAEI